MHGRYFKNIWEGTVVCDEVFALSTITWEKDLLIETRIACLQLRRNMPIRRKGGCRCLRLCSLTVQPGTYEAHFVRDLRTPGS